jgi:hypothetical protein
MTSSCDSHRARSNFALAIVAALLGTALLGTVNTAHAGVLAYEGFNYAPGLLIDAGGVGLGTAGNGWEGDWDSTQGANPDDLTSVQAGSLSYRDALGNVLTTSGGKLFNTGAGGAAPLNSQPGRTLSFRRDGAALGATATTPVATWLSFLAVRSGQVNDPTTPVVRTGTYGRGANLSLFDATLGSAANEEKLNFGENSSYEFPYTTGSDLLRIQQTDPSQIALWKEKFGKPSSLAMQGFDNWMVNAPRVTNSITAQAAPSFVDPVDGTITAAVDWQRNPVNGRFAAQVTQTPFAGQVSLMVARIDHYGGDTPRDQLRIWMNPNLNAAPTDANASAVVDLTAIEARAAELGVAAFNAATGNLFSFDRIRLFAGNPASPAFAAEWTLDEIRLGETFGDVTPHAGAVSGVPEPSALVLATLVALAASRGRRVRLFQFMPRLP